MKVLMNVQLLVAVTVLLLAVASARITAYQRALADTEAFCSKPGYRARSLYDWKRHTTIPYCEPDCSLDNGGCQDDEVCSLHKRSCSKRAFVCPDVIVCTKRSDDDGSNAMSATAQESPIICPEGHRYEYLTEVNREVCIPDCSVDNGGCKDDQICSEISPLIFCSYGPCVVVQCHDVRVETYTCYSKWIQDEVPAISCKVVDRIQCLVPPCPFKLLCTPEESGHDCSGIQCYPPDCGFGEKVGQVEGDCCPSCVLDCPPCWPPDCEEGQYLDTLEGDCCPSCVPIFEPLLQEQNNHDKSMIAVKTK